MSYFDHQQFACPEKFRSKILSSWVFVILLEDWQISSLFKQGDFGHPRIWRKSRVLSRGLWSSWVELYQNGNLWNRCKTKKLEYSVCFRKASQEFIFIRGLTGYFMVLVVLELKGSRSTGWSIRHFRDERTSQPCHQQWLEIPSLHACRQLSTPKSSIVHISWYMSRGFTHRLLSPGCKRAALPMRCKKNHRSRGKH